MEESESTRRDLEAAIEARRELGSEFEPALIESFVEKIDQSIEEQVEKRIRAHRRDHSDSDGPQFILGLASLGMGIPITAIAAEAGLPGVIAAWAGILGVNIAHAKPWRGR